MNQTIVEQGIREVHLFLNGALQWNRGSEKYICSWMVRYSV